MDKLASLTIFNVAFIQLLCEGDKEYNELEIQNVHVAEEDPAHNLIPGSWRTEANLLDSDVPQGGNRHNYSQETKGLFKSIFQ